MDTKATVRSGGLGAGAWVAVEPSGEVITHDGDEYYRIENYDAMPPFLVSLTSPTNHWAFLSTAGGITAGRRNADHAIFPYTTSDKVADNATTTGGVTIVQVEVNGSRVRWEPFARCYDGIYALRRTVEKNVTGNIIRFTEENTDLGLVFSQSWTSSPRYGVVRLCSLATLDSAPRHVTVLDGVRNTLPALTTAAFQGAFSNLLDAYKRNELLPGSKLGIFGLSAVPTDTAEPSEALAATTWWQEGLVADAILLSDSQLDAFRRTGSTATETDVKGRRGAFLVQSHFTVGGQKHASWLLCGEVDQTHSRVITLADELEGSAGRLSSRVLEDVEDATAALRRILSRNDGIQATADDMARVHHASNVTYNTMRGGYFAYDYSIPSADFHTFVRHRNRRAAEAHRQLLSALPERLHIVELQEKIRSVDDETLTRLFYEYLPVTFSRRHGDPSRPWNAFSIDTENEDGSARLAYQGNWRDIFQNWEALLHSSPLFAPNVVAKFLNATTIDGYNPYRVTDAGVDWERPDPDSPWSNIGYWGDHQIIYLQKLLELTENYLPGRLDDLLHQRIFAFADVPYRIAGFDQMLEDPYNTITFDTARDQTAAGRREENGTDGNLLHSADGAVVHTSMAEKLLILALAKASNFAPGGGIWMNTQRPEWNDANNALVGKGVSVVTTAYLERFARFAARLLSEADVESYDVLESTGVWLAQISEVLRGAARQQGSGWTPQTRLAFMRACGESAQQFRTAAYTEQSFRATTRVTRKAVVEFFRLVADFAEQIVAENRRDDGLYHSYNTLAVERDASREPVGIVLYPLYEMLEGQVAALSAPSVSPQLAEQTLAGVRESQLYRKDQHSYMLYPNRELPGFLQRNNIDPHMAKDSSALQALLQDKDQRHVIRDQNGGLHFNAQYRNARMLKQALAGTSDPATAQLSESQIDELATLFEKTFQHQNFTGRSGTFFGYEGLGSIYWHMVSKLLLATQERALAAHAAGDDELAATLRRRYYDVRSGIGFNKTPGEYGAFPMDPYSHTPFGAGAKQPGMTGQVKEEIITRFAELGLLVRDGRITFDAFLIDEDEYSSEQRSLRYVDVNGSDEEISVPPGSFGFTFCQTPVIVARGKGADRITLRGTDGSRSQVDGLVCPVEASRSVFEKRGELVAIEVAFA